jgi:hypothetical protein
MAGRRGLDQAQRRIRGTLRERGTKGCVVLASPRSPMPRKKENPQAPAAARPRRLASAARKGRRIVRTLAKSTLLAASIAVTQLGVAELDSRFQLFDRNLVDRLHAPITRYHE